jgi:hypothetical protein
MSLHEWLMTESVLVRQAAGDNRGQLFHSWSNFSKRLPKKSFQLLQEIHDREYFPLCLESLAGVISGQGEQERAAFLWGAAEALRETVGNPIPPLYLLEYQQAVAAAREQLGQGAFASAWTRGRAMTPEQVLINQNI